MSKIDLVNNDWVDLVFQGRNQEYGAYKLRKGTSRRNVISIITMLAAAALIYLGISLKNFIEASTQKVAVTQVQELSALEKPKEKAEVKQKKVEIQQPEKVVERVKSSVKFTAPVIKKEVFEVVEQMPSFPGGDKALLEYLSNNIKYPVVAQENGVQGRVVVSFVVEKDGSITDVKVVRSVDPSLDKEAARVVKSMPRWIPGKQNGSAVRVKYNVPVSFKLQ